MTQPTEDDLASLVAAAFNDRVQKRGCGAFVQVRRVQGMRESWGASYTGRAVFLTGWENLPLDAVCAEIADALRTGLRAGRSGRVELVGGPTVGDPPPSGSWLFPSLPAVTIHLEVPRAPEAT